MSIAARRRRGRIATPPRPESLEVRALLSAPGALDPTFGAGYGLTTVATPSATPLPGAVVAQANGKIVVSGTAYVSATASSLAIERFNADGTPDASFNGVGQLQVPLAYGQPAATAVQPDGKIIAALGTTDPAGNPTYLALRLNVDGTLDTTFGTGGFASYPATTTTPVASRLGGALSRVVPLVQSDGSIVLTGSTPSEPYPSVDTREFAAVRLLADGTLDASYGTAGTVDVPVTFPPSYLGLNLTYDTFYAASIQADDRVILAGDVVISESQGKAGAATYDDEVAAVRLDVDGSLDATYGGSAAAGIVLFAAAAQPSYSPDSIALSTAIQPADGKLLVSTYHRPVELGHRRHRAVSVRRRRDRRCDPGHRRPGRHGLRRAGRRAGRRPHPRAGQHRPRPRRPRLGPAPARRRRLGRPGLRQHLAPRRGEGLRGRRDLPRDPGGDGPARRQDPPGRRGDASPRCPAAWAGSPWPGSSPTPRPPRLPSPRRRCRRPRTPAPTTARTCRPTWCSTTPRPRCSRPPRSTMPPTPTPSPSAAPAWATSSPPWPTTRAWARTSSPPTCPSPAYYAVQTADGVSHDTKFGIPGAGQTIPVPGRLRGDRQGRRRHLHANDRRLRDPALGRLGRGRIVYFGTPGAGQSIPAPADYFGTGQADMAVYLTNFGAFAIADPTGKTTGEVVQFGPAGVGKSIPVPGDYDGSGHVELAVYVPSLGAFFYRPYKGGADVEVPFGTANSGQIPVPGDYDGSGRTEVAIYDPAEGFFAYRPASGANDVVIKFGTVNNGSLPAAALAGNLPEFAAPGSGRATVRAVTVAESGVAASTAPAPAAAATARSSSVPGGPRLAASARMARSPVNQGSTDAGKFTT